MPRTPGESRPISVRAPDSLHERIERLAEKEGITKSQMVLTMLEVQVEYAERAEVHVPAVVMDALPRRQGLRVAMPAGVVKPMI